jgi:hypothetical protein
MNPHLGYITKLRKEAMTAAYCFFLFLKFLSGSGDHPQNDLAKIVDDLARFGNKTYESKNMKNPYIVLATSCK